MFLGYQNNKIAFIAETKEELENMPCVYLDKIEETDKTYFLHNGEYVCEIPYEQQVEEIRQARESAYRAEVDPITCHIQRLSNEEQTPEIIAEIASLVEERKAKVEEIKTRFPYPVEPIKKIEELPVVEEAAVSKMENVEETNISNSEEVI